MYFFILQDSRCEGLQYKFKLTLTYSLNNSYSADVICRINCEASFPVLTNNAITKYMAEVWAINNNGELVGMPSRKMIGKLQRHKLSLV